MSNKDISMKTSSILLFLLFLGFTPTRTNAQQPEVRAAPPKLITLARELQEHVGPANTEYRHKDNVISWGNNGSLWQCYADCSGFVNALLGETFGLTEADFAKLFGHRRMYAYHYFDAIRNQNHFHQIRNIRDLRPGDLIAIQYADRSEHDDNTGHMMVIDGEPQPHQPSKVIQPNTRQFGVAVIDCSRSAHGNTDTRYGAGGSGYSGLGKGEFRLYTNPQGEVVGYSWSTGNPKEGFNPFENPVAIGRIEL